MPANASEDFNDNGVRDTCDPKMPGGTCVLSGYASDTDDVSSSHINGDIEYAFVQDLGNGEVRLGMGFYNSLLFNGASHNYEFFWYFDTDNNSGTGSVQVAGFGGDTLVRLDVNSDRSGGGFFVTLSNTPDSSGTGVFEIQDDDHLVVMRIQAPSDLGPLDNGKWLAVSGGLNGNFQNDTDKSNVSVYKTIGALGEDCNDNGWFDESSMENAADDIGLGPELGDGVPDECQQDNNSNGVDDSCEGGVFF